MNINNFDYEINVLVKILHKIIEKLRRNAQHKSIHTALIIIVALEKHEQASQIIDTFASLDWERY